MWQHTQATLRQEADGRQTAECSEYFTKTITQIEKGSTEETNEGMEVTLNAQICLKTQI